MNAWKLALPLLFVSLTACSDVNRVSGSGHRVSASREVPAFTAVEVRCWCKVVVASMPQIVTLDGDDNIIALITTDVRNGTLFIDTRQSYQTENLRINIGVPSLTRFALRGAGQADLSGLAGDKLELSISGVGQIDAAGEVREAELRLAGAGQIDAGKLKAQTVRARMSGAGEIRTWVSEDLDAVASGVGSITYLGDPKRVSSKLSGVGSISRE